MIDNLVSLYEQTSQDTRRRGRRWYPNMRNGLREIAREHDRTLSQVAAITAITSVDAQLVTNLTWTLQILRGEREAGRYPLWQAHRIRAVLEARYPARHVSGPKVEAFYRAVMGDLDALVLDRWMLRPVGHVGRSPGAIKRALYEAAYRQAATECGERVARFQAIVWIHLRETTPKSNGQVPRLADIDAVLRKLRKETP